jgi:phage tail-like protein
MSTNGFFKSGAAPPTAFYFSVKFKGMDDMDCSFQEASGLKATFGIEEKKEGGENSFVHRLPTPAKFDNLVLKRCLVPNSKLDKWCQDAFNNFKFDPRDIQIALLSLGELQILASWNIVSAFPLSWELGALKSTTNELAIETLTLNYKYFKRET